MVRESPGARAGFERGRRESFAERAGSVATMHTHSTSSSPSSQSPLHHRVLVEQQGALLLDVRTAAEFAEAHVPRALNVPVQELAARLGELGPTSRPIVVYCRSGGRSAMASIILRQAGYQVRDIGPMSAW